MKTNFNKENILKDGQIIASDGIQKLLGNIIGPSRVIISPIEHLLTKDNRDNLYQSNEIDFYDISINQNFKGTVLDHNHNFYLAKVVAHLLDLYIPSIENGQKELVDLAVVEKRKLLESYDKTCDAHLVRGILRLTENELQIAFNPDYAHIVSGHLSESQAELTESLLRYSQNQIDENVNTI